MQKKLSTADIARLMQWHWDDQTMPVRKSWCTFMYRLRTNTDCDALFLATKWGVHETTVHSWFVAGRRLHEFSTLQFRLMNRDLVERAFEMIGDDWDIHAVRCPCRITHETTVYLEDF